MSEQNPSKIDLQSWIKESLESASVLLKQTALLRRQLFASGDLTPFLSILIRLHQYDYRNLLLILKQYPSATLLGSFKYWQSHLPPGRQVLKDAWIGKGVELLAPFTEKTASGTYALTWYQVTHYDISQTNVLDYPKTESPYLLDELHLPHLARSLQAVLPYYFRRKVSYLPHSSPIFQMPLSFQITDKHIVMSANSTHIQRIQSLTEAMARLSIARSSLPSKYQVLFSQCVCHCLFEIWLLPGHFAPPTASSIVPTLPESQQAQFLDLLQRTVRLLNESTTCGYLYLRHTEKCISDLDSEVLSLFHP